MDQYPFILLALVSFTNAQSTSCPHITIDDLGSATQFSTQGLISEAIVPSTAPVGTRVPVRINDFTIVCDASGDGRNTSSFVSVVVELRCMSDIVSLTVCDGNTDVTRQYQFQCVVENGQALWDDIVSGSTTNVQTENPTATLSTPLANQCRRCIDDVQSSRADTTNHCEPCPSQCNLGQERCYLGQTVDMCCNFYLQGNCRAAECPSALEADSNFDCVCPALTLANGAVSYSVEMGVDRNVGSVATHTCNSGHRLLPQDGGNTRICNISGWTGQDFVCEQIVCPDLTISNGTVDTSPPGRVFNSRTIYTCDEGYALKGDGNRVCQIDSTWDGTDPECELSSGASSHYLGGTLLVLTLTVLCAILE